MTRRELIVLASAARSRGALPFVVSNYRTFQFTLVLVYAIALLGLNMLTGYNGQISLGHGAFYAIGAYCTAVLMDKFGVPVLATLPCAGAVCLLVGSCSGCRRCGWKDCISRSRRSRWRVAAGLLKYHHFETWTGGVQGIVIPKPEAPFGLPLKPDQWLYFFTLAVTLVMFALAWNLLRGRVGRAWSRSATTMSPPRRWASTTRSTSRSRSACRRCIPGRGGSRARSRSSSSRPDSFDIFLSIKFLVGIVIGGLASISGAIFGALFIQFVPNIADEISKAAPWAIFGLFLIGFVYVMPMGIAGALRWP
jgi:branched-chain amino acid transport system permease protein